jgi:hypothetical protein
MANTIYTPPKYIQMYAFCLNDEKPKFEVKDWIEKDRLYKVKFFSESINLSEGEAVVITDAKNNLLRPSPSHGSYNTNRFKFMQVNLN